MKFTARFWFSPGAPGDETVVKVSVDIAGDVRLATLDLTRSIDEIIAGLREERGLAHQSGRYALQLMGLGKARSTARAADKRKHFAFINADNKHLIHHGVALRMVHAPEVQVDYLMQHLPASTSKLERLAADPTGNISFGRERI